MTDYLFGAMMQADTPINISSGIVAANVSVTGSSLPTNGLYLSAANTLGFATNNTQRMLLDTNGNMGIGTTAPGRRLDVFTSTGDVEIRARSTAAGGSGQITADGSNAASYPSFNLVQAGVNYWSIQQRGDTNLYLYRQNGTGNVSVPAGNFGINTLTPPNALTVRNGYADFSSNLNGSPPANSQGLIIGQNLSAGAAEVNFFHADPTYIGTNGGFRFSQITATGTYNDVFRTTQNLTQFYTANTERMRITSAGYVMKPYTPAFYATSNTGNFVTTNLCDLPFDNVIFNQGSCYNGTNYRFTAPIAGIYQFNYNVFWNGGSGRLAFKRNGGANSNQQNAIGTGGGFMCGSMTVSLAANDYITVGDWQSTAGITVYVAHGQFSGFLVG